MRAPSVSIVVPTHARRESVVRLLRALGAQTGVPDPFEVVIAIDGSEDGTGAAVDAEAEVHAAAFRVRWLWQPQRGRASACNAGARLATGRLLVFLDDDMEPAPGFVAAHLDAHGDARAPGAAAGVVGAAPIVAAADAAPVVRYRAAGFAAKLARLRARPDDLALTDVYTGNFSVSRDRFVSAGGYDEAFRRYGHEDYELVLRLRRAGVRFVFDEGAIAHQHYAKTFRALAADVTAEGHTAVLFARKHPDVIPALALSEYARRSRRQRARLALLLALSRAYGGLPDRAIAAVERLERRRPPPRDATLFARYDLVFDVLYWLGVERALHDLGAQHRRVPFHDVGRSIRGARRLDAPRADAATSA